MQVSHWFESNKGHMYYLGLLLKYECQKSIVRGRGGFAGFPDSVQFPRINRKFS